MKVKLWVEDEEFGEHFEVSVPVGEVIGALKRSPLSTVTRVPDGNRAVFVPERGVWLCVRVGDE